MDMMFAELLVEDVLRRGPSAPGLDVVDLTGRTLSRSPAGDGAAAADPAGAL